MFKKFKISCDEATMICDKSQYDEASFFEKIQLNWHILWCKVCALYLKQNKKMTELLKNNSTSCKEGTQCLSNLDKEAFKKELEKMKM